MTVKICWSSYDSRTDYILLLSLDYFDNLTALIDVVKVLKVMDDVVSRLRIDEVECLAVIAGVRIEAPARGRSPDLVQAPKEFLSLACLWATDKVEFLHMVIPPCALLALAKHTRRQLHDSKLLAWQ
jgi:hypothetical protein